MERITLDIDLEKFRYSLVGDGFLMEEVLGMSRERLISILEYRVKNHIECEYARGKRYGLYDRNRL